MSEIKTNQIITERSPSMFDIQQTGIKIANLRKSKGLTKMNMADELGISFQAVSNWERGISMPDISKLSELSAFFDVSIDELLANKRTSELAQNILQNTPVESITVEEVIEISPLIKAEQTDQLFDGIKNNLDIASVVSVAPFLSQNFIDEFAKNALKKSPSLNAIAAIIPFISTSIIDEKAIEIVETTGDLGKLAVIAPFISSNLMDSLADMSFEKSRDLASFAPIAPFISTIKIDEYATAAYSINGINALLPLAPFISSNLLNSIAKEVIGKYGLAGLSPIMPFIDSKIVEDFIIHNQTK